MTHKLTLNVPSQPVPPRCAPCVRRARSFYRFVSYSCFCFIFIADTDNNQLLLVHDPPCPPRHARRPGAHLRGHADVLEFDRDGAGTPLIREQECAFMFGLFNMNVSTASFSLSCPPPRDRSGTRWRRRWRRRSSSWRRAWTSRARAHFLKLAWRSKGQGGRPPGTLLFSKNLRLTYFYCTCMI